MDIKNTNSDHVSFSGTVPQHYDQYKGPMFFEPYALEIAKRIDPSAAKKVLEIACGTGRVSRHLRMAISSSSKLIASDISPDMLAVAKEKCTSLDIDWRIIDAQDLPFEDNSIDVVVCCFGYMFVPDKQKAFAEAYRVLKPGGVFLFSTWDKLEHNAASHIYRETVKKYFEGPLSETFLLAFSMNDDGAIQNSLEQAGFSSIKIERVDKVSMSPTAKEATYGLVQGGSVYNEIMKRNPAWIDEIKATVEKELTEKYGASQMAAPMRALITESKK